MLDRIKSLFRLRPDRCRDCDQEITGFVDICPNCGAANPVQIPRWVGYLILGFTVQNFLLMFS
jgi:anaerobic ribonucleoside-triphosphate reductase